MPVREVMRELCNDEPVRPEPLLKEVLRVLCRYSPGRQACQSGESGLILMEACDGEVKPATLNQVKFKLRYRHGMTGRNVYVMCRTLDVTESELCLSLVPVGPV